MYLVQDKMITLYITYIDRRNNTLQYMQKCASDLPNTSILLRNNYLLVLIDTQLLFYQ